MMFKRHKDNGHGTWYKCKFQNTIKMRKVIDFGEKIDNVITLPVKVDI